MVLMNDKIIIVRGGGDIATGIICRLHKVGFKVIILEVEQPTAVRRNVALSEAIYQGQWTVEGVTSFKIVDVSECEKVWRNNRVPILIDPEMQTLSLIKAHCLVDGTVSKLNRGLSKTLAPIVIGVGPGFTAGVDVDAVIETLRGHDLGRIIYNGKAIKNTGIPGDIGGFTKERVVHAPAEGVWEAQVAIGQVVQKGQQIGHIDTTIVEASLSGLVRGLIKSGHIVSKGMKIGDIDPRENIESGLNTISDKARCISGSVLEAILVLS